MSLRFLTELDGVEFGGGVWSEDVSVGGGAQVRAC